MFEHYSEMDETGRAFVRSVHLAIKSDKSRSRERNLAWGYIRGFKYRRIERSHHTQVVNGQIFEHNFPRAYNVAYYLSKFLPEFKQAIDNWFAGGNKLEHIKLLEKWLSDPTGAIPAPIPRPKRAYESEMRAST